MPKRAGRLRHALLGPLRAAFACSTFALAICLAVLIPDLKRTQPDDVAVGVPTTRRVLATEAGAVRFDRRCGPLRFSGESRADGVDGAPGPDYSLYADVFYADGPPDYGLHVPFAGGSHDWERAELAIPGGRFVREVRLHALFRNRKGSAEFRNLALEERGDGAVFEGVPGRVAARRPGRPEAPVLSAADGLAIRWDGAAIDRVTIDGEDLTCPASSGFLVRDAAADSSFLVFRDGICEPLGLALERQGKGLDLGATLRSLRPGARALTAVFALPVDLRGWRWERDLAGSVPVGLERLADEAPLACGATGTIARMPFLAFSRGPLGLAIAVDPERPLHARLAWQGEPRLLTASFDLGLADGRVADLRVRLFRFDGRLGFRGALERFQDLHPDAVRGRAVPHGGWLPFTKAGTIPNFKDFGFRWHEGADDVAFDRAEGLVPLRYSEPLQSWMPMAKGVPRDVDHAGAGPDDVWRDGRGRPRVAFRSEPWCDGAVWSVEPRAPAADGPGDGEFVDSVEGWASADLDHDPARAAASRWTPSFDSSTFAPVRFKAQPMFDVLDELRRRADRPVFVNGAPGRFWALCSRADLFGLERDWAKSPPSEAELLRWRAMAGPRPMHVLLNTDFDALDPADLERFVHRCLSLGFFPGCFSANASDRAYWEQPALYERDRAMWKRCMPIAVRLAAAGWRPVTLATAGDPGLRLERFGPDSAGRCYVTLHNPGQGTLLTRVTLPGTFARASEALRRKPLGIREGGVEVELAPLETWILELEPATPR